MKTKLSIKREWCVLAAAMVLFSAGAGYGQSGRVTATPSPTPPVDENLKVLTEEIKLNVIAFDENGNFFNDVSEKDLVITENNILHQPESVRRLPANVLILMDTGGELRSVKSLDRTRKVAGALIRALRPGDSVAIEQYSDKPQLVRDWTANKNEMLEAVSRTNFGRRSAFVDAINLATDLLLRNPLENKHLVLITDGTDSSGRSSAKFDAFQRLMSTDVSVHVISYTSLEAAAVAPRTKTVTQTPPPKALPDEVVAQLPNDIKIANQRPKIGPSINMDRTLIKSMKARKADLEASQQQLENLALNTNGEFILPESVDEMVSKSALVSKMIDASYVVTYTPKIPVVATHGMAERNIDVTSKRPGLIVQARRRLLIDTRKK